MLCLKRPHGLRHAVLKPVRFFRADNACCQDNCTARTGLNVNLLIFLQRSLGTIAHAALADDDLDALLAHKVGMRFHTNRGRRSNDAQVPLPLSILFHDWTGMKNRTAAKVFGERLAGVGELAKLQVSNVSSSADLPIQINNVADLEFFNCCIIKGQRQSYTAIVILLLERAVQCGRRGRNGYRSDEQPSNGS